MGRYRSWIAIAVLICSFAVLDVLLLAIGDDLSAIDFVRATLVGTLFGVVIGQLNLISVWAAMATGPVVVRLPWALLLTFLLYYALVLGAALAESPSQVAYVTLLVVLVVAQLCVQVPLWVGSRWFNWQLVTPSATIGVDQTRSQFSISQLMTGTALLALTFGAGRLVLPADALALLEVNLDWQDYVVMGGAAICNLLFVVPCVWGAFLPFDKLIQRGLGWGVVILLATTAEFAILATILGGGVGSVEDWWVFLVGNYVQCFTVAGTLLILRWQGFRLLRTGRTPDVEVADFSLKS